jgi:hypothetical protein
MKTTIYGTECEVHDNSPMMGDIVRCTDKSKHLNDPKGYRVEYLGIKGGYGQPFGSFAARGLAYGGVYLFYVNEYEKI